MFWITYKRFAASLTRPFRIGHTCRMFPTFYSYFPRLLSKNTKCNKTYFLSPCIGKFTTSNILTKFVLNKRFLWFIFRKTVFLRTHYILCLCFSDSKHLIFCIFIQWKTSTCKINMHFHHTYTISDCSFCSRFFCISFCFVYLL